MIGEPDCQTYTYVPLIGITHRLPLTRPRLLSAPMLIPPRESLTPRRQKRKLGREKSKSPKTAGCLFTSGHLRDARADRRALRSNRPLDLNAAHERDDTDAIFTAAKTRSREKTGSVSRCTSGLGTVTAKYERVLKIPRNKKVLARVYACV